MAKIKTIIKNNGMRRATRRVNFVKRLIHHLRWIQYTRPQQRAKISPNYKDTLINKVALCVFCYPPNAATCSVIIPMYLHYKRYNVCNNHSDIGMFKDKVVTVNE